MRVLLLSGRSGFIWFGVVTRANTAARKSMGRVVRASRIRRVIGMTRAQLLYSFTRSGQQGYRNVSIVHRCLHVKKKYIVTG